MTEGKDPIVNTATIETPADFSGKNVTYVRREDGAGYDVICGRCGGTGYYSGYSNIDNGICFQCNGNKGEMEIISNEKAAQLWTAKVKRAEKKEAARLAEVAKLARKVEALRQTAPDVVDFLLSISINEFDTEADFYSQTPNPNYERSSFIRSMAEQLLFVTLADRAFTDNMVAAVRREIEKRAAKAAEPVIPVVEGRGEVAGEIVSIKRVENDFGSTVKILVKDDRGFKVYGTLQKDILSALYDLWYEEKIVKGGYSIHDFGSDVWFEIAKGQKIQFMAMVETSRDDKGFGFFSRPTKGVVL